MAAVLPEFVEPMLAKPGTAFDSDRHLFEVKWDGTRGQAFVERGQVRLLNRRRRPMDWRYPELGFLAELPAGCALDGEVVVFEGERTSFHAMLRREQARSARAAQALAGELPAAYVVFDLLYRDFEAVLDRPLSERRTQLAEVVADCENPRLLISEGVIGNGLAFFEEVARQELEGVVAKRLDSRYEPGRRSGAWVKIKRRSTLYCAVIGYLPQGNSDFKSLLLATDVDGELTFVGGVGSGIRDEVRRELNARFGELSRDRPLVPCPARGRWLEPGLFCTVSYLERTRGGLLRAPVFHDLVAP